MKLVIWLTVVINSNNIARSSYISLQGSWNLNIQRWLKPLTQPSVTDHNCCIPPDTRYVSMATLASGKWIRVELVNNIPLKNSGTMRGGGFLKDCGLLVQQTRCRWVQMIRPLNSHNTTMRLTISAVFSRQHPHFLTVSYINFILNLLQHRFHFEDCLTLPLLCLSWSFFSMLSS